MKQHGYAIRNNGTAWSGIPAAMKHFGLKDVKNVSKMSDVWSYLSKGYCAVFLFRGGSRGGVCWTTAGHYMAVTGYKVKNGKHYLYMRDSGGRNHTGWYAYETTMKGLIPQIWVGKVPTKATPKAPTTKYTGTLPTLPSRGYFKSGDKGDNVKQVQKFLNYAVSAKLSADGKYGPKTMDAVDTFERQQGLTEDSHFGKKCLAKAQAMTEVKKKTTTNAVAKTPGEKACEWAEKIVKSGKYKYKKWKANDKKTHQCPICHPGSGNGWNCIGFVTAAYHHGAGVKTFPCDNAGLGDNNFFTNVTADKWRKRNGKDWVMISNNGKKGGKSISQSKLKPGDIIICYLANGTFQHIAMYVGNGYYVDSSSGYTKQIGKRKYSNLASHLHVTRAFRLK